MPELSVETTVSLGFSDAQFERDLPHWIDRIQEQAVDYRKRLGCAKVAGWWWAMYQLSLPRLLLQLARGELMLQPPLQIPWMPRWPALLAQPLHDQVDFPWTALLRDAAADIRSELWRVCDSFGRARYQGEGGNEKPWRTFYFYLEGKPIERNLAACPRTREVLSQIPHNRAHVCFSAVEPEAFLNPHTGPTNANLIAHLGLANCEGATLWSGGQCASYREGEVVILDDSFVHWVEHHGKQRRFTLMVTFWHPQLNRLEREFLALTLGKGAA